MKKLNRITANKPVMQPVRVMQFGGGNFLRAFCDWMFDVLNKTTDFNGSVAIIKPTERGDYTALKSQEGLFHVALDGIRDGALFSEINLVESVSQVIQPYKEWGAYLQLAEQPEIRFIVSNTTESGIIFSEIDKQTDAPPKEFPAKLTLWLFHRFNYFKGAKDKGCVFLPCELIENNGDVLKDTIIKYATYWKLEQEFINWIENSNVFCSTLVDRIVSGFPEDRKKTIEANTGYKDELLVAGEDYHSWVIKAPNNIKVELPFERTNLNVRFVDNLTNYREMKVRILNGAHTALVPVGYLAGLRTVKDSMDDDEIRNHVLKVLSTEVKPTLKNFSSQEIDIFINAVIDRFKNPTLKHYLIAISLNSTSKFQARLLPAFKEYTQKYGVFPKRIAFSLACMIRFYKGEFNDENIPLNDNVQILEFFEIEWEKVQTKKQTIVDLVTHVLSNVNIVGEDLRGYDGLVKFVSDSIININKIGVKGCLAKL
ncbi:tagaturonate reductase [Algibacter pacificus]|uniref:tagaturonate reductase n=1 Tax=Algibacter pacificus TaxID=2599389 RepID=UPI0011C82B75|nr:tagaturonate reductase [Algibacter pacificus]